MCKSESLGQNSETYMHTLRSTTAAYGQPPTPIPQQWQQQVIYPKLVLQIPCTPIPGTLYNQLSTLPCIFKPKFLPSKHKRPPLQLLSLYSQKDLSFDKRLVEFKDFCLYLLFSFPPDSGITLSFPTQILPLAVPNTVSARVASVFSHSRGPNFQICSYGIRAHLALRTTSLS